MKRFLPLLAGTLVVSIICFAILFWIFNFDKETAITSSISVGLSGLIIEYLKPYFSKSVKGGNQKKEY